MLFATIDLIYRFEGSDLQRERGSQFYSWRQRPGMHFSPRLSRIMAQLKDFKSQEKQE